MGYMLPLRFIKVSNRANCPTQSDVAICATRIVAICSTDAHFARQIIKDEKRAGTLINASGRDAVKSCIILDNGSVIASPFTVQRLMTAIEKSNSKGVRQIGNETARLRVYDVVDEEPNPELDEEVDEATADNGDMLNITEEEMNAEYAVYSDSE